MPFSSLNAQQREAATAALGNNLVIASAGTGKTSTIVARIAHLLSTGVQPKEILLLTFTNKAANEMIERLAKFVPTSVAQQIEAGTFHAVSYRWLKAAEANVTLKQPRELRTLFGAIYERYASLMRHYDQQPYAAAYLFEVYDSFLGSAEEDFCGWLFKKAPQQKEHENTYLRIFEEFERQKKEFGFVGFSDLLVRSRELGREGRVGKFVEALVDEYQDTNNAQYAVVEAIRPKSLFCVGDYDQSIYGFNGANIDIIASFTTNLPDARIFTLTKNYRSTRPILTLANRVIERNERIYPKSLEVVRDHSAHSPTLLEFDELFVQYRQIAQRISKMPINHENIAVLFRNNSSADGIEACLRELNVRCRRRGGVGFFEAREVRALLDLFSLFVNPRDMLAFMHTMEFASGIGAATAKELCDALRVLGHGSIMEGLLSADPSIKNPFATNKPVDLGLFGDPFELGSVSRFKELGFDEKLLSNPIMKYSKLTIEGAQFLHDLYDLFKKGYRLKSPSSLLEAIASSAVFGRAKESMAKKRATRKDKSIDPKLKEDSIGKIDRKTALLQDLARRYEDRRSFLNAMVLGAGEMSEGDGVHLLSVHGAKGLEFKVVFIIDLMEGRFPNRKLISKGSSLDEERRLFYVAVTRAKDELVLSYARYDQVKKISYLPSVFLKEAGMVP